MSSRGVDTSEPTADELMSPLLNILYYAMLHMDDSDLTLCYNNEVSQH